MSQLKSAVLTPSSLLVVVIAVVWCSVAIGSWLAVLVVLPFAAALIGFAIAQMATEGRATKE